jgi:hypothetical protein
VFAGTGVLVGESSAGPSSLQGSGYPGVSVVGTNVYPVQQQHQQQESVGQQP